MKVMDTVNKKELDLTAAILVQLGDTLATISTQRAICSR